MLQRTAKLVADCHQHAVDCAEKAKTASTPEDREFYLGMQRRWTFLATSYEFTDRLSNVTDELDRHRSRHK